MKTIRQKPIERTEMREHRLGRRRTVRRVALLAFAFVVLLVMGTLLVAEPLIAWKIADPPQKYGTEAEQVTAWRRLGENGIKAEHLRIPCTSSTLELDAWFLNNQEASSCVVLLHGIADSKARQTSQAEEFFRAGFHVVMLDLRGHGRSEGRFCTYGWREKFDVVDTIDYIRERYDIDDFFLVGYSLGAAISLQTFPLVPEVRAVVAIGPFVTLEEVVLHYGKRYSFHLLPKRVILASLERAGRLADFPWKRVSPLVTLRESTRHPPILLIHSRDDERIPYEHSLRLKEAYRGPAQLWSVEGIGHLEYWREMRKDIVRRSVAFFLAALTDESRL